VERGTAYDLHINSLKEHAPLSVIKCLISISTFLLLVARLEQHTARLDDCDRDRGPNLDSYLLEDKQEQNYSLAPGRLCPFHFESDFP